MMFDKDLIAKVGRAFRRLKITRPRSITKTLCERLSRITTLEREARHRRGYASHSHDPEEFSRWEQEQVWPE